MELKAIYNHSVQQMSPFVSIVVGIINNFSLFYLRFHLSTVKLKYFSVCIFSLFPCDELVVLSLKEVDCSLTGPVSLNPGFHVA